MRRRVVITGVGTISALGAGREALWAGLVEGRSALGPIRVFDASGFRSRLAGEVRDFTARDLVPKHYRKAVKVMARDTELAVGAALFAAQDAGLITRAAGENPATTYPGERVGCQIGAGLIAAETPELAAAFSTSVDERGVFSSRLWGEAGESGGRGAMNNLQPLWLLKFLPNMLACHVTIIHGLEGPSNTITCAEASGLLSIGEGVRVIERGDADCCFSGGVESKINPMGLLRLDLEGRLAPTGEREEGGALVRPYDPGATGTIAGEGGGVLILEERGCARARGARVYAEIVGFGAGHASIAHAGMGWDAPDAGANDGLERAVREALRDAGVGPESIDAIVPGGFGIPSVDMGEALTLRAVFADRLARIPLVTCKPNIGACSAGDGALLAAIGAMCCLEGKLPARVHHGRPASGLDAGEVGTREARPGHVLVCTPALGGQNAAMVLRAGTAPDAG